MSSFGTNRTLAAELKEIKRNGVEGFTVDADEDNILSWQVGIFGIPGTVYEGGYFKASLTFPQDYPFNPPKMKFDTFMYHPNVYTNGELCISILHPAIHDETSGESLNERWNPTQNVRTVLLSVISLLNEPNISSPANVDAAVAFRKWREGRDNEFEVTVKRQVAASKIVAEKEGIKVPLTQEDYCIKEKKKSFSKKSTKLTTVQDTTMKKISNLMTTAVMTMTMRMTTMRKLKNKARMTTNKEFRISGLEMGNF